MMNEDALRSLTRTDLAHFIHPQYHASEHQAPVIYVRGEGAILFDAQGRQYIDGLSCLWNVAVGHGRRELAEVAARQMAELAFCSSYTGYSNVPAIELAERLCALAYPNMAAVFYANSGSEAVEGAFKVARFYWYLRGQTKKAKIICRKEAYHGGTLAATSATGMPVFWRGFEPMIPGFVRVGTCYCYHCEWGKTYPGCGLECVGAVEEAILREGSDTVAAVIAEPVHGAGGVIPPVPEYFPRLREVCDRHQVLLIADEVITGFGRTGRWFALEHWGVQPDILTIAKAVTSAYIPLSAFLISRQIHEAMTSAPPSERFMHAYTNSGHPTACAVALANLRIIEEEGLVENARRMGERLLSGLRSLEEMEIVGEARGLGLMAGVELTADKETHRPFEPSLNVGGRVLREARERGLVARVKGDSFLVAPPLVITADQVDRMVEILRESIRAVEGTLGARN
jgi:adenosylmethionine-8-amino-7-oxononanoate aminotransferase